MTKQEECKLVIQLFQDFKKSIDEIIAEVQVKACPHEWTIDWAASAKLPGRDFVERCSYCNKTKQVYRRSENDD